MREYTGLRKLSSVGSNVCICPKCHNKLIVVDNGFFHGEVFFCPKEKKVFFIELKEIKEVNKEFLENCDVVNRINNLKNKINNKNIDEVEKILLK